MKTKKEWESIAGSVRGNIVQMITDAGSGHPGGSLSVADILVYLYFEGMHIDPQQPGMENRDRLVLSKGHSAPALYAVLAERGYFSKEELKRLRKCGSMLQGHPDMKRIPGVDMSTGSLGQGLSAANGMALSAKLDQAQWRVYAVVGDGELQEGQVWEAAMSSAHYGLDNLTLFIDHNGLQIDGSNDEVMKVMPIAEKFRAFGWHVIEVNGHSYVELAAAVELSKENKEYPTAIVAHTVKGKGVSFMENQTGWHGKAPTQEECQQALAVLTGRNA